jgi:N-acylneuraminate cytidylyltransferase
VDRVVRRGRVAIIPARGGSKRLPRKNVVDFGGKPMLAWTIEAAREASLFDRVIVSTDDAGIAETARMHGAEVPFMREGLAGDHTGVSEVTIGALRQAAAVLQEEFDTVVQLMANCPLRSAPDVRTAVAAFEEHEADFQISCVRFGWLNPWWALRRRDDGTGAFLFPDAVERRSQDLEPLYCPTGAIWIARTGALRAAGTFYGPGHRFEPLPWISAIDIDDEDDLALARVVLAMRHENQAIKAGRGG